MVRHRGAKATVVVNVMEQKGIEARPHCKGGFTGQGRVVIANKGFYNFGENEA